MQLSKALVVSCGVILGVTGVYAGQGLASHRTVLTFSGPVALPGTLLTAGTYTFELADPGSTSDVVIVFNRNRTRVFYMGLTERVARPPAVSSVAPVTFGEAARGTPTPVDTWYPPTDSVGHRFMYTR